MFSTTLIFLLGLITVSVFACKEFPKPDTASSNPASITIGTISDRRVDYPLSELKYGQPSASVKPVNSKMHLMSK